MEIKDLLKQKKIKPSAQRICILEFIINSKRHPTIDEIYEYVSRQLKAISLTTIYSTVYLLQKRGILRCIFDGNDRRYDIITPTHFHFICEKCGKIFDVFDFNLPDIDQVEGNTVNDIEVIFKGICAKCKNKRGKNG